MLIAVPLVAAAVIQWATPRARVFQSISGSGAASVVPLMMLVLFVVVASQAERITAADVTLVAPIPLFVAFLVS